MSEELKRFRMCIHLQRRYSNHSGQGTDSGASLHLNPGCVTLDCWQLLWACFPIAKKHMRKNTSSYDFCENRNSGEYVRDKFESCVSWDLTYNSLSLMAPHSSTLAWKIPWAEEPGGLQSMGLRRVAHDWATSLSLFTFMHWRRKGQPTPVFLPGESQGRGSLVGCCLWGHTESDTTEAT